MVEKEYKYNRRTKKIKKKERVVKTEEQLQTEAEQKKKKAFRVFSAISFFTAFSLIALFIIAGAIFVSFKLYGERIRDMTFATGYEYTNGENNLSFYRYDYESKYFYGEQYISTDLLRTLDDLVLVGDGDDFSVIFDGDNIAKFHVGSALAEINGASRILSQVPVFAKDTYFIPVEFIKNSILGLEFTKSSDKVTYRVQKNELYSTLKFVNVSKKTSEKPTVY